MKKIAKFKIINSLSDTLVPYDPNYKGYFLCPICFSLISIHNLPDISVAHIFPEAAGGKITTWLCKRCNSILGTKVDKWFGEYLIAIKNKSIFDPRITTKGFSIDGIKLNGAIKKVGERLDLLIDGRRNSKITIEDFNKNIAARKDVRTLKVEIPLLGKTDTVNIGFITAAYLYGFSIFGYSWVMQNQFDSIRTAISNQSIEGIENAFVSNIEKDEDPREHYFGISIINKTYIPCFKIMSKMVFFTASYARNSLKYINEKKIRYNIDIKRLLSIPNHIYTRPFIMTIGDKVIIYPDKGENKVPVSFIIMIDENTFNVTILNKFVDAKFEEECRKEGKQLKKYSVNLSDLEKPST